MANLKSQYVDAVIDDVSNPYPKYIFTWVQEGRVAMLEDVTSYLVDGTVFGADDVEALAEGYCRLDTSAASGTVDGDLFQLITDMGWSDVVISGNMLDAKALFNHISDATFTEETDGDWIVRKYSNGTEEAFYSKSQNVNCNTAVSTVSPSFYRGNVTVALPTGWTTASGVVQLQTNGSQAMIQCGNWVDTNVTAGLLRIGGAANVSTKLVAHIWKTS